MSDKIIFLDIDGVLNSETDFTEAARKYDPVHAKLQKGELWKIISAGKLALLNRIIKETDAKIVLSSTWRSKCDGKKMTKIFQKYGDIWEHDADIFIGQTPNWSRRGCTQEFRGREITQYLSEHPEIEDYIVLDDNDYILEDDYYKIEIPEDRFIHTDEYAGLTKIDMWAALIRLGRTEKYQKKFDREQMWLRAMIF